MSTKNSIGYEYSNVKRYEKNKIKFTKIVMALRQTKR